HGRAQGRQRRPNGLHDAGTVLHDAGDRDDPAGCATFVRRVTLPGAASPRAQAAFALKGACFMKLRPGPFVASLVALASAAAVSGDAHACGGCFPPAQEESQSTVVTGHRMAFAVSTTQTVLWDQIQYQGSPKEFAWVLPIHGPAVLELASDAWFETLDASTTAQVLSPPYTCG